MRLVYAFPYFDGFRNSPLLNELIESIVITSSKSMSASLTEIIRDFKYRPTSFSSLVRKIAPEWKTDSDRIMKMSVGSEFFRKKLSDATEKERDWIKNCRKNKFEMISSIELLVESGIQTKDIKPMNQEQSLLVDLWEYLETNFNGLQKYQNAFDSLSDGENITRLMKSIFGENHSKTAYLIGFFYITPQQERFFDLLESTGYNIVVLADYDERYPRSNEIWRRTLSDEHGYSAFENWHLIRNTETVNQLGEVMEGRESDIPHNVELKRFDTIMDFARSVENDLSDNITLFSTDEKSSNDILKDFFPDRFDDRFLISHPMCQLIYEIHKMWDDESESVSLKTDSLGECFATGWIHFNGHSSREYMYDLTMIAQYFEGCDTLDKWESRMNVLSGLKTEVISCFERATDHKLDRWGLFMSNPFANLSMFSINKNRLQAILTMISSVVRMTKELLASEEPVSLTQYFEKLREYLKSINDEMDQEDVHLMDVMIKRATELDDGHTFLPRDLTESILRLLENGLDELDELFGLIEAAGIVNETELDLSLARGLNYYTGAIFEVKAKDFQIGSICGGGRYDNLTGIFGLPGMSGVGISFGADRIYDVLKGLDLFPKEVSATTRVLFANMGLEELKYLIPVVKRLRDSGIPCEIYHEQGKLKKQFEYAEKRSIPFLSITGGEEAARNEINIKNLVSGEQRTFPVSDIQGMIDFIG